MLADVHPDAAGPGWTLSSTSNGRQTFKHLANEVPLLILSKRQKDGKMKETTRRNRPQGFFLANTEEGGRRKVALLVSCVVCVSRCSETVTHSLHYHRNTSFIRLKNPPVNTSGCVDIETAVPRNYTIYITENVFLCFLFFFSHPVNQYVLFSELK